jgi:hypothetical protein
LNDAFSFFVQYSSLRDQNSFRLPMVAPVMALEMYWADNNALDRRA